MERVRKLQMCVYVEMEKEKVRDVCMIFCIEWKRNKRTFNIVWIVFE